MGKYRKVDPRIWGDARFRQLSGFQPSAKALWFWFLTNPYSSNFAAAIPVGVATIADDLRWSSRDVEKMLGELTSASMVEHDSDARLFYIVRWLAYNQPESSNVAVSWVSSILSLPECELRDRMLRDVENLCSQLGGGFQVAVERAKNRDLISASKGLREPLQLGLGEGLQESKAVAETETEKNNSRAEVEQVYLHYRKYHPHCAPKLRSSTKEYQKIRERLRDGYSVESLCLAIDGNHSSDWHNGKNPDGKVYHSLELIMRDSSHVAQFVEVMSTSAPAPATGQSR